MEGRGGGANLSGPRRCGLEYLGLHVRWQIGINRKKNKLADPGAELGCALLWRGAGEISGGGRDRIEVRVWISEREWKQPWIM